MRNKKRSGAGFWIGMLVYILLFITASAFALRYLYQWLDAYERSQVIHAVEAYESQLHASVPFACLEGASEVDVSLQPQEEIREKISGILADAKLVEQRTESTGNQKVYRVKAADGNQIGTVFFTQTGEQKLNFTAWALAKETYDFSSYYSTQKITVPSTFHVSVNGTILGEKYIVNRNIPFRILSPYDDGTFEMPKYYQYTSGTNFGKVEFKLTDSAGNAVSEDEISEEKLLDNCNSEERAELQEFLTSFLRLYIDYTAYGYRYETLKQQYVVLEGDLHNRLRAAYGSFGYVTVKSCEILSEDFNFFSRLSDGRYLVDMTYTTETEGRDSAREQTTRNIRLLIIDTPYGYRIDRMTNY